ncbi:MAG: hypothetical protein GX612_03400 [Bacteroidales bacterium]|nr:hypothetical protein [Bacteroidales bacterium]
MKTIHYILIVLLFFSSCVQTDYSGTYWFTIKNSTQKTITLKFIKSLDYGNNIKNMDEVILLPKQEKVVRTFLLDGVYPNDVRKTSFNERFSELVFDTYVDGKKFDKELWQPENWTFYAKKSEWEAEYKMIITDKNIDN